MQSSLWNTESGEQLQKKGQEVLSALHIVPIAADSCAWSQIYTPSFHNFTLECYTSNAAAVIAWQSQFQQVKYNIRLRVAWNKMENKSKQGHHYGLKVHQLRAAGCSAEAAKNSLSPFSAKWNAKWRSASSWCRCDRERHLRGAPVPMHLLELGHRATTVMARSATAAAAHCFKMLITVETFTISGGGEMLQIYSLYCTHSAGIEAAFVLKLASLKQSKNQTKKPELFQLNENSFGWFLHTVEAVMQTANC